MSTTALFHNLGVKPFLRKYPVNGITIPHVGHDVFDPTAPVAPPRVKGDSKNSLGSVDKALRVRWLTFQTSADPGVNVTSVGCPSCTKIMVAGANNGGVPAFHLPYQNNENIRLTLNAAGPNAANADFFLTEQVDGCSIYVEGTAQTPTVYHINAANYADSSDGAEGFAALAATNGIVLTGLNAMQKHQLKFAMKSSLMDRRFQQQGYMAKTVRAGVNLVPNQKLEDNDYMIRPVNPLVATFEASLPALKLTGTVPTQVGGKSVDRMSLVGTQAFVFGIRTGLDWKFYVQRQALVEYYHRTTSVKSHIQAAVKYRERPYYTLGMQRIVRDVVQFWPTRKV